MPDAHLEAYLNFLLEVLQATYESDGDKQVVYPLLQANSDKLDDTLIQVLQTWASDTLPQAAPDEVQRIVTKIHNFSTLIQEFPLGSKAVNQEMAIVGYEIALTVWTREAFPENWARTQNNLGNAYWNRIRGERADNLEVAIAFYNAALAVSTRSAFPYEWARTQNNLGNAYLYRIQGEKAENLEVAIASYKAALSVRTRSAFPYDWAITQENLGLVYRDLRQIPEAFECFRLALEICTPTAFPLNCLKLGRHLGKTAFQSERWSDAIEGYDAAIQAVEQSCEWACSDRTRQELRQGAIDVYTKIVQACINNNQIKNAIEYIERSKARTLVELLANRNLLPKGDVPSELLKQLQQLKRELPDKRQFLETLTRNSTNSTSPLTPGTVEQLRQEVSELQSELQQVLEQIQRIDPSYQLTQIVHPIPYTEIRDLLDNQTAILLWYITSERFFTFVITHQNSPYVWQSSADDLAELEQWRENYLNDYDTFKRKKNSQWQTQLPSRLEQLSAILHLDEILTQVPQECEQLILIPHRYLHLFPLHALPLGNLTPPDADSLRESTPATETRYQPWYDNHSIDTEYCLTLQEIFEKIDLPQCHLVTLCAYETGLTDFNSLTDEYVGFASGFLYAGSLCVICSLWKVDDLATAFLMIKFYENLRTQGENTDISQANYPTVAKALNEAQCWLKKSLKPYYTPPTHLLTRIPISKHDRSGLCSQYPSLCLSSLEKFYSRRQTTAAKSRTPLAEMPGDSREI